MESNIKTNLKLYSNKELIELYKLSENLATKPDSIFFSFANNLLNEINAQNIFYCALLISREIIKRKIIVEY